MVLQSMQNPHREVLEIGNRGKDKKLVTNLINYLFYILPHLCQKRQHSF
jgi:hypothetical protein